MEEVQQIPAANEVVAVLLAKKCVDDKALLAAVKSDPVKAFDIRDATLRVRTVQNTRDVLHVCVPDYGAMQELESDELEQVSGGTRVAGPAAILQQIAFDAYRRATAEATSAISSS